MAGPSFIYDWSDASFKQSPVNYWDILSGIARDLKYSQNAILQWFPTCGPWRHCKWAGKSFAKHYDLCGNISLLRSFFIWTSFPFSFLILLSNGHYSPWQRSVLLDEQRVTCSKLTRIEYSTKPCNKNVCSLLMASKIKIKSTLLYLAATLFMAANLF